MVRIKNFRNFFLLLFSQGSATGDGRQPMG